MKIIMTGHTIIRVIKRVFPSTFLFAVILSIPALSQSSEETTQDTVLIFDKCFCYNGPTFPGGTAALYKWMSDSLSYPENVSEWYGQIVVEFDISDEGEVDNPRIIKGGEPAFEDAIIKVINKMPNWQPAFHLSDGKPYRSTYVLPITFERLEDNPTSKTDSI